MNNNHHHSSGKKNFKTNLNNVVKDSKGNVFEIDGKHGKSKLKQVAQGHGHGHHSSHHHRNQGPAISTGDV